MATSGRIETGRYNHTSFYLNWQIARQDIAGNFTDINYQTGINITNSAYWGNNAIIVAGGGIAGQGIAGGTFSNKRGNGDHQLTSGTIRVYHEGDGRKTVWIDLVGRFYVGGNLTAGQNFELPTIPRQSNPTFSKRLYTLGERIVVNMNRKAGFTHRGTIQIPDGNEIMSFRDQHDSWAWTPDEAKIDEIYRRMANTTRTSLGVDITTWSGGTQIGGTGWDNVEIQIPVEENRPDFSNFGFIDQNTKVKALTGSDKIFIKGHSKIKMWVTQAQKMTTKNHATARDYTANFGGVVVAKNETTTGAIDFIFENPVAESGNLIASISARDSRNLTTTASQTIAVLDYAKPAINAVAKRQNNFDQTTELDLSGNYTNFDGRNTILLVQYRVREANGAWGAWKKPSFTALNGSWSVAKQFENFNRTSSYEIEVEARDRLEIVRTFITIGQGVPIAFISSNKKSVGIGKVPSLGGEGDLDVAGDVYSRGKKLGGADTHIGQIIISTTMKTPEAMRDFYGGTWVLWGQGRSIIGVGSNGETNYTTSEQTGGWDGVRLSGGQLPRHEYAATFHGQEHGTPIYNAWGNMDKGAKYGNYQNGNPRGNGAHSRQLVIGFGNDEPHENRSKFITAYFWKKTAN